MTKKKKTALGVRDKGGTNLRILFSAFKLQSYSDIPSYYIPKKTCYVLYLYNMQAFSLKISNIVINYSKG